MDVRHVPVVDVSALMALPTDAHVDEAVRDARASGLHATISEIRAAATDWGFWYITNHGLSKHELATFQNQMRSFFRLSLDVKRRVARGVLNSRGYFDNELTKNKTDWKECFDVSGIQEDGPTKHPKHERMGEDENQWPLEVLLPGFSPGILEYYCKMERLSRRLVKVCAAALGQEPTVFDPFFNEDNSSFLRLNHYPVAPMPDKTMGVHHHTDAGALTILLQDDEVASLQVLHRESKTWTLVPPREGTFVVNVGDMMQVWSNDVFVAPLHRVLANGCTDRFSAPFFYNPSYKTQVQPLVGKEGEDEPRYRPLSWRAFRQARFQGDYADSGKEVQIGDYKILGPIDVANS
uniref:Fe2OG dioxygenase domain-containing protein n=1 Tax=Peronospora matthiolae TaxID=2874970 RepID=A0AAV1U7W4_9STRA